MEFPGATVQAGRTEEAHPADLRGLWQARGKGSHAECALGIAPPLAKVGSIGSPLGTKVPPSPARDFVALPGDPA